MSAARRKHSQGPFKGPGGSAVPENKRRKKTQDSPKTLQQKKAMQRGWVIIINSRYPDLHQRPHLYPAVHFNRVLHRIITISESAVKLEEASGQLSDVREDESQQRIHNVLSRMFGENSTEVMMIVFELDFDNYLNDSRGLQDGHDLAIFDRPRDLDSANQRGRFDILIIHRDLGLMVFEVKAVGDAFNLSDEIRGSVSMQHAIIRKKVDRSLKQLQKEEVVLRFLLEDLGLENVPVTKGLMLPNLAKQTVLVALLDDTLLAKKFCDCLNGPSSTFSPKSLESALQKCIFSDNLPPIGHSLDISDHMIKQLHSDWWINIRAGLSGKQAMTDEQYQILVARFCGPATTQYVQTANDARAEVSTLPQAVMEVSKCYTQPVVTPEIKEILQSRYKRLFVSGLPGSGTDLLLKLKAQQWLNEGCVVIIVSLWHGSDAVASTVHQQIQNLKERHHFQYKRLHCVTSTTSDNATDGNHKEKMLRQLFDLIQKVQDQHHHEEVPSHYHEEEPSWGFHVLGQERIEDEDIAMDCGEQLDEENAPAGIRHRRFMIQTPILYQQSQSERLDLQTGSSTDYLSGAALHESTSAMPSVIATQAEAFTNYNGDHRPLHHQIPNGHLHQHAYEAVQHPHSYSAFANPAKSVVNFKEPYHIRPTNAAKICIAFPETPWFLKDVVEPLLEAFPDLTIIVTSSLPSSTPKSFNHLTLTKNIRRPPVVIKEMMTSPAYDVIARPPMMSLDAGFLAGQPPASDGPPVMRVRHKKNHHARRVLDCAECARGLAHILLQRLQIGSGETIQFGSVLISGYGVLSQPSVENELEEDVISSSSGATSQDPTTSHGFLRALRECGIPLQLYGPKDGQRLAEDHLTQDHVVVAHPECLPGLERPVVVVLAADDVTETAPRYVDPWYDVIARCTSQLIVVGEREKDGDLVKRLKGLHLHSGKE